MQSRLLSHKLNVISCWYLVAYVLVADVLVWLICNGNPEFGSVAQFRRNMAGNIGLPGLPVMFGVVNSIAIVIACFSSEKTEDELMRHFRTSTVVWIVVSVFALKTIAALPKIINPEFALPVLDDLAGIVTEDFSLLVIVYLCIFKLRCLISRRAIKE